MNVLAVYGEYALPSSSDPVLIVDAAERGESQCKILNPVAVVPVDLAERQIAAEAIPRVEGAVPRDRVKS